MAGFIALWRKLRDSPVWINANLVTRDVMITLLLNVCWKETEWNEYGEVITLRPGQCITSIQALTDKCAKEASYKQVRGAMDYLKRAGFLATSRARKKTLITLINWEKYQSIGETRATQTATSRAICGHDDWRNTGKPTAICGHEEGELIKEPYNQKPVTSNHVTNISLYGGKTEGPQDGSQSSPRENPQSEKPKAPKKRFIPPTLEEVSDYVKEKGYHFSPEAFIAFYESKGWMVGKNKMQKWKSACATWEETRKEQHIGTAKSEDDHFFENLQKKQAVRRAEIARKQEEEYGEQSRNDGGGAFNSQTGFSRYQC